MKGDPLLIIISLQTQITPIQTCVDADVTAQWEQDLLTEWLHRQQLQVFHQFYF